MLKIYNTLTRQKEDFQAIEPGKVRMYVCGMTVYDFCHIGHARMVAAFDIVQRWLRATGWQLTYVRNITDIEDKIIRRAAERGIPIGALTEEFIGEMHTDLGALGFEPPDFEPRATRYVPQMLDLIGKLEKNGLAYASDDGDVNFDVHAFPAYGRLSGKSLEQLRAGERVAVSSSKRDPLDFVLWKHSKPDEPREAIWQSSFGPGRPGWHIECSAMALELLGERFDIHGGGMDLQFPHHENEAAQSEGALGHPFVNYWMHNGFVNIDNEKMSKSLGNFFTIREILKDHDAEVVRFFLVRAHYRSQINYTLRSLDDARASLARLYTAFQDCPPDDLPLDWDEEHARRFREAMDDDFNTPIAVAALFDLASEINRSKSPALARQLKRLGAILGLLARTPEAFLQARGSAAGEPPFDIEGAIAERQAAKAARDFARADRIRSELAERGVLLEDSPSGTRWRRQ